MKMSHILMYVGTILLLNPALCFAYSDSDDGDDVGYDRSRRGWSMMRLGRGLQMLRLGKRASHPAPSDGSPASPEHMRALLADLLEENRNQMRRHPPLPRYGRNVDLLPESSEDLYSLLGDDFVSKALPLHHYSRYIAGGRFRRSADLSARRFQTSVVASYPGQPETDVSMRAAPLPRIGRYLNNMYRLRPTKAVPAPRIGRQEDSLSPVAELLAGTSGKAARGQQQSQKYVRRAGDAPLQAAEGAAVL